MPRKLRKGIETGARKAPGRREKQQTGTRLGDKSGPEGNIKLKTSPGILPGLHGSVSKPVGMMQGSQRGAET
jgi:hypothetical protein